MRTDKEYNTFAAEITLKYNTTRIPFPYLIETLRMYLREELTREGAMRVLEEGLTSHECWLPVEEYQWRCRHWDEVWL